MEAHAQSGWLCELVVGSDDARVRECEFVELLVDTGATEHSRCTEEWTTSRAQDRDWRPVKTHGTRTVDFPCQGKELRVGFTVVDVKRPILSASRLMDRGIETLIQAGKQFLRRFDGATDLPPIDEEMERELMGREEVEPPVAIEVPAPDEPTSDERRHHGLTHLPYHGATSVSELDGKTAYARQFERPHESIVLPFAERVMWKDRTLRPAKLKSSWGYGLWLGRQQTSNAHVMGTRVGIVVARTIRRLLASKRED